jgi:type II secretory pathway component PulC
MKLKYPIPRFVVIIIVIAMIGLGMKFIKPGARLLAKTTENEISVSSEKTASSNGTDQLIINALLKVKNGLDSANKGKFPSYNEIGKNNSFSDYQIIIKDNLFRTLGAEELVEIKPVVQETVIQPKPQFRPNPPGELLLTGIVRLGDKTMALMEDTSTKKSYFLGAGDSLKDYLIESVGDQSITLVNKGSSVVCKLGDKVYYSKNGVSQIPETTNEQKSEAVAANADKSSSSPDGSSSTLSLIEQMKARRRKELEK